MLNLPCYFVQKNLYPDTKVESMRYILLVFLLAGMGGGMTYVWHSHHRTVSEAYQRQSIKHAFMIVQAHKLMGFDLVDPEQAPPHIRNSVMRGYRLFMNTSFYAPDYVKNQLDCTNCHFVGGDTLGGKNAGISLVGVTAAYPRFSKRSGKMISLVERITNCFQRSMNGRAPPPNSRPMNDLVNYLSWISKEVESIKNVPWLGLTEIKSKHQPNPEQGKKLYIQYCAACHREDGQGGGKLGEADEKTIPPLWGVNSFNDGAGMNTLKMLAPFIYLNMPYQQAFLTEEQALDVASFILQQPRPHFISSASSLTK